MKWLVIAITVVAALTFAGVAIDRRFIDRKEDVGSMVIRMTLVPTIERFHHDVHRYPTTEEGLHALVQQPMTGPAGWRGPYLDSMNVPVDP